MDQETTKQEERGMFIDSEGIEWRPRFSTAVLLNTFHYCNITLAKMLSMDINIADLAEALWFACEKQAKKKGIKQEEFFEEHVTPAVMPKAMKATWEAFQEAFPDLAEAASKAGKGALKNNGPFALGKFGT